MGPGTGGRQTVKLGERQGQGPKGRKVVVRVPSSSKGRCAVCVGAVQREITPEGKLVSPPRRDSGRNTHLGNLK